MVGLEIHVQLNHCPTKLFSAGQQPQSLQQQQHSLHSSPWPPNTVPAIHPYDVGVPGIMPVLSVSAVRYAILMAGLLHCTSIHPTSRFERKHYTYSDLPHSYQITQQRWPIATNGLIQCEYISSNSSSSSSQNNSNSKNKNSSSSDRTNTEPVMIQCRINRLQLEQDTAKTTSVTKRTRTLTATAGYDDHDSVRTYSRIDMNRAGIPLCEIVTEPDLRSAQEASTIVHHLRQLIQYTHISSAHMQHGQLRVDCNVNIVPIHHDNNNNNNNQRPRHKHPRVEVKNLNSIQQIEESIQYEAYRQVQVLEERYEQQYSSNNNNDFVLSPLLEETRTYNALSKRTELLRYKDQQQDYRFLPELDLPPCIINRTVLQDCATIAEFIDKYTPTLPLVVQEQLVQHLGLSPTLAAVIVTHDPTAVQYFRRAVLYALNHHHQDVPDSSTFNVNDDTNDRTATQLNLTLEEIAKCCDTPRAQLHKVANEVANLQCNVLFHVMKEQHRSNLRQSNSVRDDDDDNDDESVVDDGIGTMTMNQCPITARQLGEIVQMIRNEEISYTMAKQLIELLSRSGYTTTTTTTVEGAYISPRDLAQQRNMTLMKDSDLLRNFCTTVMLNHPDEVHVYQQGGKYKAKMEKFFIGKVMSVTHGNAHPERLRDIVMECLASSTTTTTNITTCERQN